MNGNSSSSAAFAVRMAVPATSSQVITVRGKLRRAHQRVGLDGVFGFAGCFIARLQQVNSIPANQLPLVSKCVKRSATVEQMNSSEEAKLMEQKIEKGFETLGELRIRYGSLLKTALDPKWEGATAITTTQLAAKLEARGKESYDGYLKGNASPATEKDHEELIEMIKKLAWGQANKSDVSAERSKLRGDLDNAFRDLNAQRNENKRPGSKKAVAKQTVVAVSPTPPTVVVDSNDPPKSQLNEWAQARHAALLTADKGLLSGRFINLSLLPSKDDAQGAEPKPYESLQAMLSDGSHHKAWVLSGEPGGGKSTLLHALEFATLKPWLSAAQTPTTELCIPFDLRRLRAADAPPDLDNAFDWIENWLQKQWSNLTEDAALTALPTFKALREAQTVRLLFDGLNEIDAATEAQRGHTVRCLAEWLARSERRAKQMWLAPVFTVRTLNYSQTLSSENLEVRRVQVRGMDKSQIQDFSREAFNGNDNNPVWRAIKDDAELEAFFDNPFNLRLQCDLHLYCGLKNVMRTRVDLLAARTWARLQTLLKSGNELASTGPTAELLTADDRRLIVGTELWSQADTLWRLPTGGELIRGLDAWAYKLHVSKSGALGEASVAEAQQHVPRHLVDAWWLAVRALDVVVESKTEIRFRHHLYQEFFAARHLARLQEVASWPSFAAPAFKPKSVAAWEPLPLPEASPWDQAARMAVKMCKWPERLVQRMVEQGNLPLAARALAALGENADTKDLRRKVNQLLIDRSQSSDFPLSQRLEAGLALGEMGDRIRYEEHTGVDNMRYLLPVDALWRRIEKGSYPVGGLVDWTPSTQSGHIDIDEQFEIAFAPVTNAEFALFVQQGGYRTKGVTAPPPWWDKGHSAHEFWHGRWRDDGWGRFMDDWRALSNEQFVRACELLLISPVVQEAHRVRRAMSQREYIAERERLVIGEMTYEPELWRSCQFNNPLQPVVGVSRFEAQSYVNWINHLTAHEGLRYALPTEAQWEAAARGLQGRLWPWGESTPNSRQMRMNHSRNGRVGSTSPVASWLDGATPEGVFDMAGEVWEWTLSSFVDGPGPIPAMMGLSFDEAPLAAVRGGSWFSPRDSCRAAVRGGYHPGNRYDNLGLRLVRRTTSTI